MQTQTDLENKVKAVFKKVLDIKESEIIPGAKLDESIGIDSTEMVELSVAIKKELGVALEGSELKKTHSFNEIIAILKSKTEGGSCGGHSCGCKH
ncbi:MAG: acyl carrier protein [Candidatus Omnitrophica bacterium]|nr:acyl carrier protein [Candidatus Omnitrophota bacterium]